MVSKKSSFSFYSLNMLSFYDKMRLKGGDYMMNPTDRYFIERKYHDPEKEFDAFSLMAYHGTGYIEESGLGDEELLKGLEQLSQKTAHLPHPVARAKAIKYVLENERLYINEHDYFVGLYSLNRLANESTFKKW